MMTISSRHTMSGLLVVMMGLSPALGSAQGQGWAMGCRAFGEIESEPDSRGRTADARHDYGALISTYEGTRFGAPYAQAREEMERQLFEDYPEAEEVHCDTSTGSSGYIALAGFSLSKGYYGYEQSCPRTGPCIEETGTMAIGFGATQGRGGNRCTRGTRPDQLELLS